MPPPKTHVYLWKQNQVSSEYKFFFLTLDIWASGKVRKTRQGLEASAGSTPPLSSHPSQKSRQSPLISVYRNSKHKAPPLLKVQSLRIVFHEPGCINTAMHNSTFCHLKIITNDLSSSPGWVIWPFSGPKSFFLQPHPALGHCHLFFKNIFFICCRCIRYWLQHAGSRLRHVGSLSCGRRL